MGSSEERRPFRPLPEDHPALTNWAEPQDCIPETKLSIPEVDIMEYPRGKADSCLPDVDAVVSCLGGISIDSEVMVCCSGGLLSSGDLGSICPEWSKDSVFTEPVLLSLKEPPAGTVASGVAMVRVPTRNEFHSWGGGHCRLKNLGISLGFQRVHHITNRWMVKKCFIWTHSCTDAFPATLSELP